MPPFACAPPTITHRNALPTHKPQGAYCWDVDGNKYIDYIGSWGPAIVGAAHDEVTAALHAQLDKGTSFGAPCELENVLARMVVDRVPSVEMVRFVNSGTEACLSVVRLMRAYTKREKILKFVGCYHGHADQFLVQAGSGVITLGLADSPGVMASTAAATLTGVCRAVCVRARGTSSAGLPRIPGPAAPVGKINFAFSTPTPDHPLPLLHTTSTIQ